MADNQDNPVRRAARSVNLPAEHAGNLETPIPVVANQVNVPQRNTTQKVYNFVPFDSVGDLVHLSFEEGMRKIIITPNKGGGSCTMVVEP